MHRRKFMERITSAVDLDTEPLPGRTLVELAGENMVLIENHSGVCKYSPQEIGINVSYGKISVAGAELELAQMTKERLVITGRIDQISLWKG